MSNKRSRGSSLHEDLLHVSHARAVDQSVEQALEGGANLVEGLAAEATSRTLRQSSIGRLQHSHGNQSTQRLLRRLSAPVMRDDDKTAAPTTAAPATAPASAASASAPADVTTNWFVDYQYLPISGTASAPKTRSAESALYIDELKAFPDGAVAPLPILSGVNAAESGKVGLGTLSHPDQKGGKVSGKVRFGGKPDLDVKLMFTQETKPAVKTKYTPERKAALGKITAELNKQLKAEAAVTSDIAKIEANLQAKADALLPPGSDSHSYQVKILVAPKPQGVSTAKVLETIPYPSAKEGANYDVLVDVPLETSQTQWTKNVSDKKSASASASASATASGSTKVTITESERTKLMESVRSTVTTSLKSLLQEQKTRLKTDRSYKELSGKGTLSGDLAGKLGLEAATKELPIPIAGKVLKYLLKIDAKAGAELSAKLGAGLEVAGKTGSESTESVTDSELSQVETAISSAIENFVSKEVETQLTKAVEDTFSVSGTVQVGEQKGGEKVVATTAAGTSASYKTGVPRLKLP